MNKNKIRIWSSAMRIVLSSVIVWSMMCCLSYAEDSARKPNIIFILADDQGWTALGEKMDPDVEGSCSDYYRTPNLDKLAQDGMRFSQGYAPAPVCSPTRHSIQFGKTPANIRVTYNNAGKRQHCDPQFALANLVKAADASYVTAHFGKWHISFKPSDCGFDFDDGIRSNSQRSEDERKTDPKFIYSLTSKATEFIENQVKAGKPFYLQISHFADHVRFESKPETVAEYKKREVGSKHKDPVFAAMNENLDEGVGMVLKKIEELGIADNTYVFYMADNGFDEGHGDERERGAWPLAFSKGYVWEGGVRVPFIVRGPGIKAGSVSSVQVVGYDLLPTFLEIIKPGFTLPAGLEGGSIMSLLQNGGDGAVKRPNDYFVFHYPSGAWPSTTSIIKDNYKLIKSWEDGSLRLFDLSVDISEAKDLAAEFSEKASELDETMTAYLKSVNAEIPTAEYLEQKAGKKN